MIGVCSLFNAVSLGQMAWPCGAGGVFVRAVQEGYGQNLGNILLEMVGDLSTVWGIGSTSSASCFELSRATRERGG